MCRYGRNATLSLTGSSEWDVIGICSVALITGQLFDIKWYPVTSNAGEIMFLFGVTYMVYLVQKDLSVTRRFAGFLHRSNVAFSNTPIDHSHDGDIAMTHMTHNGTSNGTNTQNPSSGAVAGSSTDHRTHHIPGVHHHHSSSGSGSGSHGNIASTLNFTTPSKPIPKPNTNLNLNSIPKENQDMSNAVNNSNIIVAVDTQTGNDANI